MTLHALPPLVPLVPLTSATPRDSPPRSLRTWQPIAPQMLAEHHLLQLLSRTLSCDVRRAAALEV